MHRVTRGRVRAAASRAGRCVGRAPITDKSPIALPGRRSRSSVLLSARGIAVSESLKITGRHRRSRPLSGLFSGHLRSEARHSS